MTISAGSNAFGPVAPGQRHDDDADADDAAAIAQEVPGIRYISPGANAATADRRGVANWNTQVQGAGADLPRFASWSLQYGIVLLEQDVRAAAKVAVLGIGRRDQLFGAGAIRPAPRFASRTSRSAWSAC